jgi:hypothetical protein
MGTPDLVSLANPVDGWFPRGLGHEVAVKRIVVEVFSEFGSCNISGLCVQRTWKLQYQRLLYVRGQHFAKLISGTS